MKINFITLQNWTTQEGVILSGHMDVVPVGQKWTSNPFTLTDKGDENFMEEVQQI